MARGKYHELGLTHQHDRNSTVWILFDQNSAATLDAFK